MISPIELQQNFAFRIEYNRACQYELSNSGVDTMNVIMFINFI
jgi:hypothetical protein